MPDMRTTTARAARGNGRKFGPEQRTHILELLETGNTIAEACATVGCGVRTLATYRKQYPRYNDLMNRALDTGERLRDYAVKFTPDVRERFLDDLRQGIRIGPASRNTGMNQGSIRAYIAAHPDFRREVTEAISEAVDRVEHAAYAAAIEDRNPALIKYILNNRRKNRWQTDSRISIVGQDVDGLPGGPVEIEVVDKTASTARLGAKLLEAGPAFAALAGVLSEALTEGPVD